MKFKCLNCNREWVISKTKLIYIRNWPDSCPDCGSEDIRHEKIQKTVHKRSIDHRRATIQRTLDKTAKFQ